MSHDNAHTRCHFETQFIELRAREAVETGENLFNVPAANKRGASC